MMTAINNFFHKLNNHFTYRQRFVFFSFVFILTTPIPGYWLFNIEKFFINRAHWQIEGTHFQALTGNLFHDIIRYSFAVSEEELDGKWKEANSALLEKAIEARFDHIRNLIKTTDFKVRPNLGYGFTSADNTPLDIQPAYLAWLHAQEAKSSGSIEEFQQRLTLANNELLLFLDDIGDTFEIVLAPSNAQIQLINTTLNLLPTAEALIAHLHLFHQQILEDSIDDDEKLQQLVYIDELKANLFETKRTLNYTYDMYGDTFKAYGPNYSLAKQALADYMSSTEKYLQDIQYDNGESQFESLQRSLEANDALRKLNESLTTDLFTTERNWYKWALAASLAVYITVALWLTFYIIFRVLTRHLMELCYHLRDMTRGNFKTCFTSHFNDEFGMIGRTFDKMSHSVQDVLRELKKLGTQLTDSISQITRTVKTQEDNATSQEKKLREIESTAKLIAHDSRELANRMNELNKASSVGDVADSAKEGLDRMQEKMANLASASNNIITSLSTLGEKVGGAHALIAFMAKVSDQARLLSLNSAIETASITTNKASFLDITQKIQRFSQKTSESTEEIRQIIDEISTSVMKVRQEAHGCLNEITEGAHKLINLGNQLSMIIRQGKEQMKKFENVNEVMQMQAIAAENIINSITHLGETAEENTKSIRTLHQSIEELGHTAEELQKSIGLFV